MVLGMAAFQCSSTELTSARLYIQQKNYSKAIEVLEQEVAKNPKSVNSLMNLGILSTYYGDYDKARELQSIIPLFVRTMFALPLPLGFKVAMEVRGFQMGPPRQPLSDAEQFNYNMVKTRIEKIMAPILKNLN